MSEGAKSQKHAAGRAANISDLQLTLGRVGEAIETAKRSVDLADRSGDAFQQLARRTTLAAALHQAGQVLEAEALCLDAERIQKERQPHYPLLYSVPGYHYHDLLLARGDHRAVIERGGQTLEWAMHGGQGSLLSVALENLSLGRAHLLAAQAEGTDAYKEAWAHLHMAVDKLREAATQHNAPLGLLARAALYTFTGNFADARADLNEAMDIATRDPQGHMKLHVTDCHLGHARLALAEEKADVARGELAKARALIEETGYHRRDAELRELEGKL